MNKNSHTGSDINAVDWYNDKYKVKSVKKLPQLPSCMHQQACFSEELYFTYI